MNKQSFVFKENILNYTHQEIYFFVRSTFNGSRKDYCI
jgi:hypothetical protein